MINLDNASLLDSDSVQGSMGQNGDAESEQILDSDLFRRFPMTPIEFGGETGGIGKVFLLAFYPYKERMGLNFKTAWSWIPSRTQIRVQVGFQLDVSDPSLVQHLVHVHELLLACS